MKLAWGAKVSDEFARKLIAGCAELGSKPNDLMGCIAFENMEKFRSDVVNPQGGATGLIQFMPYTAPNLGTTTAQLAKMTPERQLDYVFKYFEPFKGKLKSIDDLYMAILWPKAVGKASTYILFDTNSPATKKAYFQNKGLDANKDGRITKTEAAAQPRLKLAKGLKAPYVREIPDELETEPLDLPSPLPPGVVDNEPERHAAPDRLLPVATNVPGDPQTYWIQTRLKAFNYYTGTLDGKTGGKLFGAITGFVTDWDERDGDITPPKSDDDYLAIRDALRREITYAWPDFRRPVSKERADAHPDVIAEVAPEVATQKKGFLATVWGAIVSTAIGIWTQFADRISKAFNWIMGNKDTLPDQITEPTWIWSKLSNIPPVVWFGGMAVVFSIVAFVLIRAVHKTVADVRTGRR